MNGLLVRTAAALAAIFFSGAGCTTAPLPNLPAPVGEDATIFVPGYKGSFLSEASGEHAWITPGQALGGGDRSLALPVEGVELGPHFGPLHPDGPLTKLSILGIGPQIYGGFLEAGRGNLPGLVAFGYDWRADVRDSGRALCERIEALPARRVAIVAHSMGGLVALSCLKQGAKKISRVAFVGTPFAGSPLIMKDLFRGDAVGRNKALLSAEALLTFAAAFQLLPPKPDFFVDESGKPVAIQAFSEPFWTERGAAVFADAARRQDGPWLAQLKKMIAAHDGLYEGLAGFAPAVEALAIVGTGHPTVSGVLVAQGKLDFDHPPGADGDGTVTAVSARPAFPHREVTSLAAHGELLNDREVQRAIIDFIAGADR